MMPSQPVWRAVLLSVLVGPGAGQFANHERLKGAGFVLGTLGAFAVLLVRLVRAVLESIPTDLDPLDLGRTWALSWEIQRRYADQLTVPLILILVLWAASTVDAYVVASRRQDREAAAPSQADPRIGHKPSRSSRQ